MPAFKINIVLFGIGNVGSTLINQVLASQNYFIEQKNIDLRFPIIATSTLAFFENKGIQNKWESNFAQIAIPYKIADIIEYVREQEFENLIFVDATASNELVKNYPLLIENKFNIVAANKKGNTLSYDFYEHIRNLLKIHDRTFLYETNVGAGLPVIKTINDFHFSGEKVNKIRGVFSGSLSYIFNRFSAEDTDFSVIINDAEKNGYTEPDSRDDLSGHDIARKLLILAREVGEKFEFSDIKITSLLVPELTHEISKQEYALHKKAFDKPFGIAKKAQKEGHVLRYIGELDLNSKTIEVKLTSTPQNTALGQLKGADNLIEIYTESYGEIPIVIQGAGAGSQVTARGVLSDILRTAEILQTKSKSNEYLNLHNQN
jgi:aspartokinase/homoserine dehydrogenase 1